MQLTAHEIGNDKDQDELVQILQAFEIEKCDYKHVNLVERKKYE